MRMGLNHLQYIHRWAENLLESRKSCSEVNGQDRVFPRWNQRPSITEAGLQVEEHRMCSDLKRDELHQVYLRKTHYA